ncbi:MAG: RsmB/NOP family class I SAM-dependent RNA methyltransferase [Burkholderiales bacterium]
MHPQALLEACTDLVRLTLQFEHPADAVVSHYFRDQRSGPRARQGKGGGHAFGSRERATLTETIYTVLRKKLLFEAFAQGAPKGAGDKARRLAILGFHGPRDFLKSVLNDAEKTWLDACDAAMAAQASQPPGTPVAGLMDLHRHNLPDWLAASLKAQLDAPQTGQVGQAGQQGSGFWALVHSLNTSAPLDLRVNQLQDKRAAVQAELQKAGIASSPTPFSPWGLRVAGKPALNQVDAYTRGAVEVQDEGSQLLALLLDAGRGEMVVDFCAGAGGKTLALGAAMRNTGRLYAMDTSAHRLDALKPRLSRSGLSNVHPLVIAHERDERIKRLAGKIDRVLVDAPCSGLGTLRRNPDLKWRQNPKTLAQLALTQAAILQSAARLLKPGGRLVYATCSLLTQENEEIADAFTRQQADFAPLPVAELLGGLKVENAASLCSGLYLRLWPHLHQTDGFFAAAWEKK